MKDRSKIIARTALTVVLGFAVVGSAGAGAVVRRGEDRSRSSTPQQQRDERQRPQAERQRPQSERQRPQAERERPQAERQRPQPQQVDRSRTYRPPAERERARDAERIQRRPDATPSYRRDEDRNRQQDRSRYDDRYRRDRDTREFDRIRERDDNRYRQNYPRTYRPPRYHQGRYYYDHVPYYYNRPFRYGYWIFDPIPNYSLRSSYYHYGYFPYIPSVRVIIVRRPVVTYVEVPLVIKRDRSYYEGSYYLDSSRTASIEFALDDIERAWTRGDADSLLRYVRDDVRIDVLLDGEYNYSINADDYREMTRDAVGGTRTIDFDWYSIKSRGDDRVIARAEHQFYTRDGDRRTVYVSYQLERIRGEWIITEVGSSLRR